MYKLQKNGKTLEVMSDIQLKALKNDGWAIVTEEPKAEAEEDRPKRKPRTKKKED